MGEGSPSAGIVKLHRTGSKQMGGLAGCSRRDLGAACKGKSWSALPLLQKRGCDCRHFLHCKILYIV